MAADKRTVLDALHERKRAAEATATELENDIERAGDPRAADRLRRRRDAQLSMVAEIDRMISHHDDAEDWW